MAPREDSSLLPKAQSDSTILLLYFVCSPRNITHLWGGTGNCLYTELSSGQISLVNPKLGQRVLQESRYRCQGMGWSHHPKPNHREELTDAQWRSLGPNSFISAASLTKALHNVLLKLVLMSLYLLPAALDINIAEGY